MFTELHVPGGQSTQGGKRHPRNQLNDLTGKEWIRFTRTWFVHNPPPRSQTEIMHPAKFPEGMVQEFIRFFTKRGEWVFDPFMGVASTLVAARREGRNGIGIELSPRYFQLSLDRLQQEPDPYDTAQYPLLGDSTRLKDVLARFWDAHPLLPRRIDFTITSPPYWDMLSKSRGQVESNHKKRAKQGIDTIYSDDPADLGNVRDYDDFIERLGMIFDNLADLTRPGRYLVIVIQNIRTADGVVMPCAWDLARRVSRDGKWLFQGEKIWCQDNKKLGIWGYPKLFVPNYHHHYCLIFRKPEAKHRCSTAQREEMMNRRYTPDAER